MYRRLREGSRRLLAEDLNLLLVLLVACLNGEHLLRHGGKDPLLQAVELVEAAPGPDLMRGVLLVMRFDIRKGFLEVAKQFQRSRS